MSAKQTEGAPFCAGLREDRALDGLVGETGRKS